MQEQAEKPSRNCLVCLQKNKCTVPTSRKKHILLPDLVHASFDERNTVYKDVDFIESRRLVVQPIFNSNSFED